jgi:hypothetical protein
MTIASAVESSEALETVEARHMCPERVLSELMTQNVVECHGARHP